MQDFRKKDGKEGEITGKIKSQLRQWPIQMQLISPTAPYYECADVLLTADCVAYTMGGFHPDFLKGKSIGIACPKLDDGQESGLYEEKIKSWIEDAKINTLTVMIMQVPCCMGLVSLVQQVLQKSSRKIPVKSIIVSLEGEILQEEWIST